MQQRLMEQETLRSKTNRVYKMILIKLSIISARLIIYMKNKDKNHKLHLKV